MSSAALPLRPLTRALAAALAVGLASAAGAATPARAGKQPQVLNWSIGKLEVAIPGEPQKLPEGTLVEGHTLKAVAKAYGESPVPTGTFLITLSAFKPDADLPQQPAGMFYVKGNWRLTRDGANLPAKIRHSPDLMQGQVTAALPIDPTAGKGGWTVRLVLSPWTDADGRPHRGEGSLTVGDDVKGELVLTLQ